MGLIRAASGAIGSTIADLSRLSAPGHDDSITRTSRELRSVALWASFTVAAITYAIYVSPIGFNATDDGFILSQSARLLNGEVPHLDFVSPRPVGSALIHMPTLLLPGSTLMISRWVVLIEMGVASIAQVLILVRVFGFPKASYWVACIAVGAFVINLHSFPLMAWHTIDGVLLVSVGALIVLLGSRNASQRAVMLGALIAGVSVVTKQSFAPVVLLIPAFSIGLAPSGLRAKALVASWAVALPSLAYLAWCWLSGADVKQLLAGGQTPGLRSMIVADRRALLVAVLFLIAPLLAVFSPRGLFMRWIHGRSGLLALSATQVILVVWLLLALKRNGLVLGGQWSWTAMWLAIASLAVVTALSGPRMIPAVAIPIIGVMASLSWGYAQPSLVAGSMAVLVGMASVGVWAETIRHFRSNTVTQLSFMALPFVRFFAVALFCAALLISYGVRTRIVYRDLPSHAQISDLGQTSNNLSMVTSNPQMAEVLRQVRACLAAYPTERMAVVPDGAIIPRLFGKTNPLPVDWWYPAELVTGRESTLAAAQQSTLDPRGHLVLFQTFNMGGIAGTDLAIAEPGTGIFDYPGGLATELFTTIPGEMVVCGSFLGRYQAAVERKTIPG